MLHLPHRIKLTGSFFFPPFLPLPFHPYSLCRESGAEPSSGHGFFSSLFLSSPYLRSVGTYRDREVGDRVPSLFLSPYPLFLGTKSLRHRPGCGSFFPLFPFPLLASLVSSRPRSLHGDRLTLMGPPFFFFSPSLPSLPFPLAHRAEPRRREPSFFFFFLSSLFYQPGLPNPVALIKEVFFFSFLFSPLFLTLTGKERGRGCFLFFLFPFSIVANYGPVNRTKNGPLSFFFFFFPFPLSPLRRRTHEMENGSPLPSLFFPFSPPPTAATFPQGHIFPGKAPPLSLPFFFSFFSFSRGLGSWGGLPERESWSSFFFPLPSFSLSPTVPKWNQR